MKASRLLSQMSLIEAFEAISRARHASRGFSLTNVSKHEIVKLIELTQLAPSSFNLQPYKLIVVQSDDAKAKLARAMLGPNIDKVLNAPFSVVFAADKDPVRTIEKLIELEKAHGTTPAYISSLPSKITFLLGKGNLSNAFRRLATHIASPISAAPSISPNNEAWAMKNTALAAQQFMLAATAMGLDTAPMEGFDQRRVCYQLNIPEDRYCIPMVVSAGYPINKDMAKESEQEVKKEWREEEENKEYKENKEEEVERRTTTSVRGSTTIDPNDISTRMNKKARYPIQYVCFSNEFGNPFMM